MQRALALREDRTYAAKTYDEFKEAIEKGFARVWWAGSDDDERRIQEETRATLRCYPLAQPGGTGTCFYTGQAAQRVAVFARAY
jgi:prolyl-tRNA synthetase